ncbi:MAG: helix-turn-helix transcriptional regulator [Williamsia sp.]|nr:helix-turn-helix transcriptional regulator [Williamsia sp.]
MENVAKIDFFHVKKSAIILRALNHQLRQQIFKLLEEKEKLTVTDIYKHLKLEQSVASQHLAILRRAGIVRTERDGKFVFYILNHKRIDQIDRSIKELM